MVVIACDDLGYGWGFMHTLMDVDGVVDMHPSPSLHSLFTFPFFVVYLSLSSLSTTFPSFAGASIHATC